MIPSPLFFDPLNGGGVELLVPVSGVSYSQLFCYGGSSFSTVIWSVSFNERIDGSIATGDINYDGKVDIYVLTWRGKVTQNFGDKYDVIYALGSDGKQLWNKTVDETNDLTYDEIVKSNIISTDINGDGYSDIVYATYNGYINAVDGATHKVIFNTYLKTPFYYSLYAADVDADTHTEIVSGEYILKQKMPDLEISRKDVKITGDIVSGSNMNINYTISNVGMKKTSAPFSVNLKIDGVYIGEHVITEVEAGKNVSGDFKWVAQEGYHTVEIIVDENNVIEEYNESNNYVSLLLDISGIPSVELSSSKTSISITMGQSAEFPIEINANETSRAVLSYSGLPSSWMAIFKYNGGEIDYIDISRGDTKSLTFQVITNGYTVAGKYDIKLFASVNGTVQSSLTITVNLDKYYSFTVESKNNTKNVRQGRNVWFPVEIINNGNIEDNYSVQILNVPTGWEYSYVDKEIIYIPAFSSSVFNFVATAPHNAIINHTYNFTIYISSSNVNPDITLYFHVKVGWIDVYPKLDFIRGDGIITDNLVEHDNNTAVITVYNRGNVDADYINYTMYINGNLFSSSRITVIKTHSFKKIYMPIDISTGLNNISVKLTENRQDIHDDLVPQNNNISRKIVVESKNTFDLYGLTYNIKGIVYYIKTPVSNTTVNITNERTGAYILAKTDSKGMFNILLNASVFNIKQTDIMKATASCNASSASMTFMVYSSDGGIFLTMNIINISKNIIWDIDHTLILPNDVMNISIENTGLQAAKVDIKYIAPDFITFFLPEDIIVNPKEVVSLNISPNISVLNESGNWNVNISIGGVTRNVTLRIPEFSSISVGKPSFYYSPLKDTNLYTNIDIDNTGNTPQSVQVYVNNGYFTSVKNFTVGAHSSQYVNISSFAGVRSKLFVTVNVTSEIGYEYNFTGTVMARLPDISVAYVNISGNMNNNSRITIFVQVINTGNVSSYSDLIVNTTSPSGEKIRINETHLFLNTSEVKTLIIEWTPKEEGKYVLHFTMDSDNEVLESNETNNAKEESIIIAPVIRTDVGISEIYVGNVSFANTREIIVSVRNYGNSPLYGVPLLVYLDGGIVYAETIDVINASSVHVSTFEINDLSGNHTITAHIEYADDTTSDNVVVKYISIENKSPGFMVSTMIAVVALIYIFRMNPRRFKKDD